MPVGGILSVEILEDAVEGGVFFVELFGFFEEGFGGDGEELAGVLGSVGVEDGAAARLEVGFELVVVFGHDPDPGVECFLVGKQGGSVDPVVGHVEAMGEFVEDDVVAIAVVVCTGVGGGVGEDDGAVAGGEAECV